MSREQNKSRRRRWKYQRRIRNFRRRIRNFRRWLADQIYSDAIAFSLIVLAISILIVGLMYRSYARWTDEFWKGVFIEFTGMIFDVAVFGVLIAFFIRITERRREIRRQEEIIDDFKKWDSDEARYRIAGAIRRLSRLGKTDIDFGGIELRNFSFRNRDIKSIKGSLFYDGTWGEMGSRDQTLLERVDFFSVDCRDVTFSPFNPFSGWGAGIVFAQLTDCNFVEANLANARFTGATLEWTTPHPEELGIWHEMPDGGQSFQQTHYPPFSGADLTGVSFADATFKNADFREAENILSCDFKGATGLETCLFDDEEIRDAVFKSVGTEGDTERPKESGVT